MKKIISSGIVVALYTFISRIFGLVRELFIASWFGTGPMADAVNVALKLPNLFRRIFAEGAFSAVFIPMYSKKYDSSKEEAELFAGKMFLFLLLAVLTVVFLFQLLMPYIMFILAPGFQLGGDKFEIAVMLCRITMPYLVFISLSVFYGSMLNSIGKFAALAFMPVLMNIGIIIGTIMLDDITERSTAISLSVILAGILQFLFMYIALRRSKLVVNLTNAKIEKSDKDLMKFIKRIIPAIVSSGAMQINLFISQSIASFIPGAISILAYADRIYQFPLSIIGIAFATVLLPTLSKLYRQKDQEGIDKVQDDAIKFAMFLSLPATAGIIILAEPLTTVIYERGAFTNVDTIKTAETIASFTLGLPAYVLAKIFTPIFYANDDTKTPMRLTIYTMLVNTLLNVILMVPFDHVGIALGSSIAAWYNTFVLMWHAKKRQLFTKSIKLPSYLAKIIICTLFMSLAVIITSYMLPSASDILGKVINLLIVIIIGKIVYLATSILSGIYDLSEIKNYALRIYNRKNPKKHEN